jgi:hypothetical protein
MLIVVYWFQNAERAYRAESALLIFGTILVVAATLHGTGRSNDSGLTDRWPFLLALSLWAAIMLPLIRYPFLSDDYVFAARTTVSQALAPHQFFRPLFSLVFLTMYHLGGGSTWAFHALAFALHVGNAWLVSAIGRRLSDSVGAGWLAGGVFLLSPLQPEATLWVSGIQDVLWTGFALCAVLVSLHARQLTIPAAASILLLFAAGLLSKETAVCIPLMVIACDAKVLGFSALRSRITLYLSLAGALAIYLLLWTHFAGATTAEAWPHISRYFVKEFLRTTFGTLALPWNAETLRPPSMLVGLVSVLVSVAAFRVSGVKPHLFAAGVFLALTAVMPLGAYLFVGRDLSGARYLYASEVGWAMLIGALAILPHRSVILSRSLVGLLLGATAVLLLLNLRPWNAVADLMHQLDQSQDPPDRIIRNWADTAPCLTHFSVDGVPDRCGGVYIFRNGYEEYLRLRRLDNPK